MSSSEERTSSLKSSFKPISPYSKEKAGKGEHIMQASIKVFQLWSLPSYYVGLEEPHFEKAMLEYFLKGDVALQVVLRTRRNNFLGITCIKSDFSLSKWSCGGSYDPFAPYPKRIQEQALAAARAVVERLKVLAANHQS